MYKIDTEIVCSSRIDHETLVLNLDTGFYYTLDQVGQIIWNGLLENQTKDQILTAIINEYKVAPAEAEKDFTELMTEFENEGLVQVVEEVRHDAGKAK